MAYAIRITWQEGTPQRQGNGFRIYRSVNGGAFSLYATVPISQTSYDDTNIAAGNYYRYAVCEYKVLQYGTGESPWAYTDTIFCPAPPSRIRMTFAPSPANLAGWKYRRKINLNGASAAGTNYQVLLKIGESSGATGCDFHLDGKSSNFPSDKNQGGDLRFTAADGLTLLSFWIEKVEGTSPNRVACVWVKVSADLSTNQSIYCYFGNPNATNASDGNATFLFFDDFDGTSLDSTKWVAYADNYSVSNSILRINVGGIERTNAFSFNLQNGYMAEVRVRHEVSAAGHGGVLPEVASSPYTASLNANSDATIFFMRYAGAELAYVWIGSGSTNSYDVRDTASTGWTPATGTWYVTGISINGGTVRLWANGAAIYTASNISWAKNITYVKLGSFNRNSGNDIQDTSYDWVRVRKYVSPEPAFSSAESVELLFARTIYWDAPGLQQGYEIERSVSDGPWTSQATPSASATSWAQSGLSAGNKYRYRIRSVGTGAWRSDWAYTEGSYYGIKVTWTEGAPDKPGQGFRIYRKRSDEQNYTLQAELPLTTTSYNDANVTQNYSYTYKIVEWKGWLEDEPAYVTAAVPNWSAPNNQPQNLTVTVINA